MHFLYDLAAALSNVLNTSKTYNSLITLIISEWSKKKRHHSGDVKNKTEYENKKLPEDKTLEDATALNIKICDRRHCSETESVPLCFNPLIYIYVAGN